MPLLPPRPLDNRLARFFFVVGGNRTPVTPTGTATLTRAPGDENAFYTRDKLSSLTFSGGEAWRIVWGIENSNDRCQPIGLVVETRHKTGAWALEHQAVFTTTECKPIDPGRCSFTIQPTTDDNYRELLENFDTEVNLLECPAPRLSVRAQLALLAQGVEIEFYRTDRDHEAEYVGKDGWTLFYRNDADIYVDRIVGALSGFQKNQDVVVFRYLLRDRPLHLVAGSNPPRYTIVTKSGYQPLNETLNPVTHTISYAKTPDIDSFRAPTLVGFGTNTPFKDTREYTYGGQTFLSVPCGDLPSQHGYVDADYVRVTGPDGGYANGGPGGLGAGGVNSAESPGGACLNVREEVGDERYRAIFWRFGNFEFTRCFPLLDGLHWVLNKLGTPPANALGVVPAPIASIVRLLPPLPAQLSAFYSDPTNQATGDTAAANELPRLLLAAGSDIKRFNSSEEASRLTVSLKQLLGDLAALHKVAWFIDPVTGWLRIEHQAYAETLQAAGVVIDLTAEAYAVLPQAYSYETQAIPRFEELSVANAQTQNPATGRYFDKDRLDYGDSNCVNSREGQNRSTRTSSRLTGDVTALVLFGGAIPDSAIALLAPDLSGRLSDANALCAPSSLLPRYYRRGMAASSATITSGEVVVADSLRPQRVQEGQSAPLGTLRALPAFARIATLLGAGAKLDKAVLNLETGVVTADVRHAVPDSLTPPPTAARQFTDSFPESFA